MYFWSGFSILESQPEVFVTPMLEDIESYWIKYPSDDIEDICIYEFVRGVCLKVLKDYESAEWCFTRVISNETLLTNYFYLVPNSVFELAMIRNELGQKDDVQPLLLKALSYRSYSLENKLHFRIHGAMEELKSAN
jgi:hypothetical protein